MSFGIYSPRYASMFHRAYRYTGCLFLAALLCIPITTSAQPLTPGMVEESLRPPPMLTPPPEGLPDQSPVATPSTAIPAEGPRVTIEHFEFTGNTVFSDAELKAVIADQYGQALSLAEIYATADQLTAFYQQHGYSVASVNVPAQRVSGGRVRLEIVEGRISGLLLEGHQRYQAHTLERHLARTHIGDILRFDALERDVLLLNDLPGLLVRSVIEPGAAYGTTYIRLRMEETPYRIRLNIDNHGPETVGRWRLGSFGNINNLTGLGDQLDLGITVSESNLLRQGRLGWSYPIGYEGGRMSVYYSRTYYDIGGDFAALDIDGSSEYARLQYRYPMVRTRNQNVHYSLALAQVRGRSDMDGLPLSDTKVHLAQAQIDFQQRKERLLYTLNAKLASNLRSNGEGLKDDAIAGLLELEGHLDYLFADSWGGHLSVSAQLSIDPLPDSQQFSLGGPYSVRGFAPSRQRGDQGIRSTAELRRYIFLESMDMTVRGFVDAGWVQRINALDGISGSDRLSAAGLGLNTQLKRRHQLNLEWAYALSGDEPHDDRSMYWISLATNF